MMPLDLSLRKLLLRHIPQLKADHLDRYESLLALRHELIQKMTVSPQQTQVDQRGAPIRQERPLQVEPRQRCLKDIQEITKEANNIIAPFRRQFEAVHAIWFSRRQLAMRRGNLLQIPGSFTDLVNLGQAIFDYRVRQLGNFLIIYASRLSGKRPTQNRRKQDAQRSDGKRLN